MTGLEKVVWWTEYVIRNQGAKYLRNPRADVSWAEFLILDVVAYLFSIFVVVLLVTYKIAKYVFNKLFRRKNLKTKSE